MKTIPRDQAGWSKLAHDLQTKLDKAQKERDQAISQSFEAMRMVKGLTEECHALKATRLRLLKQIDELNQAAIDEEFGG